MICMSTSCHILGFVHYLPYNSRFSSELVPWVFFLQTIWYRLQHWLRCPLCHPANKVKTLKDEQSTNPGLTSFYLYPPRTNGNGVTTVY